MKTLISIVAAVGALLAGPAATAATITAAGDIAPHGSPGASIDTAKLISNLNPNAVLPLGDNQYDVGAYTEYLASYNQSWGLFKPVTHPVPGNHEWDDPAGPEAGYKKYFGAAAQPHGTTYYSYNLGGWHLIALDSELSVSTGSAEYNWLQNDLANDGHQCELAYWHEPRFGHNDDGSKAPLWNLLFADDATVVLNGHEHNYQRYAPMTPTGVSSNAGIREFVVGTGGKSHSALGSYHSNLQALDETHYGVLYMSLRSTSYIWKFIATGGAVIDHGSTVC